MFALETELSLHVEERMFALERGVFALEMRVSLYVVERVFA